MEKCICTVELYVITSLFLPYFVFGPPCPRRSGPKFFEPPKPPVFMPLMWWLLCLTQSTVIVH